MKKLTGVFLLISAVCLAVVLVMQILEIGVYGLL